MVNKYEVGQQFIVGKNFTFHNDDGEIIDVPKGTGCWINDALEHCDSDCKNCKEPECSLSYMMLFNGFDASAEARLTEPEIDEIISQ